MLELCAGAYGSRFDACAADPQTVIGAQNAVRRRVGVNHSVSRGDDDDPVPDGLAGSGEVVATVAEVVEVVLRAQGLLQMRDQTAHQRDTFCGVEWI